MVKGRGERVAGLGPQERWTTARPTGVTYAASVPPMQRRVGASLFYKIFIVEIKKGEERRCFSVFCRSIKWGLFEPVNLHERVN